jgi:hypothetical protein
MRDEKILVALAERLVWELPLRYRSVEDGLTLVSPGPKYVDFYMEILGMRLSADEQEWVMKEMALVVWRRNGCPKPNPDAVKFSNRPVWTTHQHQLDLVMSRPIRWEEEYYRL